jgi:hypothetical protein
MALDRCSGPTYVRAVGQRATADMSTASARILMRLFTVAFLLLLPSDTIGRAGLSVHRCHSSHPGIASANHSALLPTPPETTPERKDVDTTPPQLSASEASRHDRRVQSAPAPTRESVSLCSFERTTDQAARPPPFQA